MVKDVSLTGVRAQFGRDYPSMPAVPNGATQRSEKQGPDSSRHATKCG